MANAISISTVTSDLGEFANVANGLGSEISSIETNFIEAMQNIWSTELAATTVDNLLNSVNDYVIQLNSKLPEAMENFATAVNAMLKEQDQATITAPSFSQIKSIARTWTVSPTEFNLPSSASEVSDLCSSGFSDNVSKITSKLNEMNNYVKSAMNNGLAGGYVNSVVTAINGLITSGQEVIESYNSSAVENSVAADTLAQTEKER